MESVLRTSCGLEPRTALVEKAARSKAEESRKLYSQPVYDWFTEGFDTVDLKDAKALLDEL